MSSRTKPETPPPPPDVETAHGVNYLSEPFDDGERQDALVALAATDPETARLFTDLYAAIDGITSGGGRSEDVDAALETLHRRVDDVSNTVDQLVAANLPAGSYKTADGPPGAKTPGDQETKAAAGTKASTSK